MKLDDVQPGQRVAYVSFPDNREFGIVSSKNDKYAFVKFDKQLSRFGWNETTSQSCDPEDLVLISEP